MISYTNIGPNEESPIKMQEIEMKSKVSVFLDSTFSKMNRITPSKVPNVESLGYMQVSRSLQEEMQNITTYLSDYKPSQIVAPFKGTSLLMSKDKTKFFFASREGRIAIARIENKEILLDVALKEGAIWTIAVYANDKYLFSGGEGGHIKKFLLEDLSQIDTLEGHTSEVNAILITSDEKTMYSTGDDKTVLMWDITIKSPRPTQLYAHNGVVYGLDLSADNRFLASVSGDRSVLIYDLHHREIFKSLTDTIFGTTWCVKITQFNTYLAFGDDQANVYLYKFGTWERLKILKGHASRVRCMSATSDERFIITGGIDWKIFVWDIAENRPGLELKGHGEWVKAIIVSEDDKFLYSMSDDCSIKTWRLPNFDNYNILEGEITFRAPDVMSIGNRYPENIYFVNKEYYGKIDRSNANKCSAVGIRTEVAVVTFAINPISDVLCVVTVMEDNKKHYYNSHVESDYDFLLYDPLDLTVRKKLSVMSEGIHTAKYSLDGKLLLVGENFRCTVYNAETLKPYHIFRSHISNVMSIVQTPNEKYLFSGDDKGYIKSYDFENMTEIKTLWEPNAEEVKTLLTSSDSEYLIAVHAKMMVKIWATSKMIKVNSISLENTLQIEFPRHSSLLYCMYKNSIKAINFPSLTTCFIIKFENKIEKFAFSYNNDEEMVVYSETETIIYTNPLCCKTVCAYGNPRLVNDYFQYVGRLTSGKLNIYSDFANDWILEPFHINIMHLYAYCNRHDLLEKCVKDGTGFFVSKSGYSPLDICLEMNHEASLNFFYKYIKNNSKNNPLFLTTLGNSLNRIIQNLYGKSYRFLDIILTKSNDSTLNKYHHTRKGLPIVVLSNTLFMERERSFMRPEEYTSDGQSIEFLQTYFKINMVPGSLESIDFLNTIIYTDNNKIFSSKFIQIILDKKWMKIRKVLYLQAVLYIAYLTLLSAYSSLNTLTLLQATFALNIVLIIYEVCQIITGGINYLKNPWNYLDLIRAFFCTLMFLEVQFNFEFYIDFLVAFVLFVSYSRGVVNFRIIKITRYYINLIYQVLIYIFPFLTILYYSTIAFSLIFGRLQFENDTYSNFIRTAWEINLGGFDTTGYDQLMYLAFFICGLMNPTILLNLLISIMSKIFADVNSNILVADGKELAGMVLEGELFYFWNRNKTTRHHLHVCALQDIQTNQDDITAGISSLKVKVLNLTRGQARIMENLDRLEKDRIDDKNEYKEDQEEIKEMIKTVLKSLSK